MRARNTWLLMLLAAGCTKEEPVAIGTEAAGQACRVVSDCQPGLACTNDICTPLAITDITGRAGSQCNADSDCQQGLCCGNQEVCRNRHPTFSSQRCGWAPDQSCGLTADCDRGLVCNGLGLCAEPGMGEGQGKQGSACESPADCLRPLICGVSKTCEPPPFFPGVSCRRSEDELGAFRGYFEVPRDEPLDEFYRHPFPSDVRLTAGKVDIINHPSPGKVAGVDFTQRYLSVIEEDMVGYGLSQPVFIRFSDTIDRTTLTSSRAPNSVRLVDLTNRRRVNAQIQYTVEPGQFICGSALAVAPRDGEPLEPETTYAIIVTSDIRSKAGKAPIHDGDFQQVIRNEPPSDPALMKAHTRFAPLRAYMTSASISPESIAVASVFTTGNPTAVMPRVRDSMRNKANTPRLTDVTVCADGVNSPCAEAMTRGCGAASTAFHEIHAKIRHPIIQSGTRPFLEPGANMKNGAITYDDQNVPQIEGYEDLCVGITLPAGMTPPAEGWPVVIYSHGTGGDFTSGLRQVAGDLALRGIATITYDGVMHGPRQQPPGMSLPAARVDPGRLFFNPANPRGARDNVLQGVADLFYLTRLAEEATIADGATGLGDQSFDAARIMVYGHSQGTVVGIPYLAHEPNAHAGVLTGAGAELGLTLVNKRKPNDISAAIRVAFGDQSVTRLHPMIALLSWYFGPTDAIPYAPQIATRPPPGQNPTNMLHVYGVGDSFTPEVTQEAFIRAAGIPLVGTTLVGLSGITTRANGLSSNFEDRTAGAVQFSPPLNMGTPAYDGHFVGTRNDEARSTIMNFFETALTGTPEIRR